MRNLRGLARDSEAIKGAKASQGWVFDFNVGKGQIDTLAADLCISRFGIHLCWFELSTPMPTLTCGNCRR